jgi:hypothetical protein
MGFVQFCYLFVSHLTLLHQRQIEWEYQGVSIQILTQRDSFLELSFGFICCCLLTFPAFLEHHGTTVMSWLRSRTNSSGGSNSKGTPSSPSTEKRRHSPKTDENDKNSFNSYNSANGRLTFATAPAGLAQSADLEIGELRDPSSSRSRLEHIDI